jgi:hypothetical protein
MSYSNNYQKIKWGRKKAVIQRRDKKPRTGINIIHDVDPFQSPIDGSIIGSRRDLREHEKRHNVRQLGNDWAGSTRPANWDKVTNGRS